MSFQIRPANPDPNTCLGVFGLSLYTTERDLREVFSRYGPLSGVNVVYDQRTGRSRGFAFVYFERIDDSKEVNSCLLLLIVVHFYYIFVKSFTYFYTFKFFIL
uniref:RRM domain-containing protein n=1 Tax=Gopherus evgoodei TaxID=1825980 RepID=A0A8C4YJF7_9SAUR